MPSSLNNVNIAPFKSMHTTRFGVGKIFIMFLEEEEEEEEEGLCYLILCYIYCKFTRKNFNIYV